MEESGNSHKEGWLYKRHSNFVAHKWKKLWFRLKDTKLYYGESEQDLIKSLELEGCELAESSIDKKEFCFCIKPHKSKRIYYIHACNRDDQNEWMQAICFAKATGNTTDQSQACIIQ
ncbi:uncharacterized protein TRIADDRAFT_57083 [Trichoplax adhaerens]|uniref:PH domain-containing protein n=1 Tax=Trichoplax adhaerens TaxID=10228 RepID=B3S0K5_TRIAD|nr:hypothetical protein TRIADDRAFT_57083 [Trichoplax adhaerens]EDV24025.1 hypothetical protein TRIADDRAFT_57083 [Trichoplax adhaerens]|eukprot:XP_002113551.1 hypothetical protein TRIADDRAFT_57083 [Trichoplax adhaerens]